jgi:ribosomal-protein-alanine N-acetyltransferase
METDLRLQTARLELVPFIGEFIEALGSGVDGVDVVGASVPEGWPDGELSQLLTIYAPWVAEDPARLGYGPWVVIARGEHVVVGSAGFMGTPRENNVIELGFGIHRAFRSRGYATESARALLAWGLAQASVEKVVAKCEPSNASSVRVLEKVGMTCLGDEGGMLLWETMRA